MRTGCTVQSDRAFTLIEMVVSTALMALVLGGAYACLRAGFAGQRLVQPRADVFQTARVVLDRLSADLRCACPLPHGAPFLGVSRRIGEFQADNLDFATHNYTPNDPEKVIFASRACFGAGSAVGPPDVVAPAQSHHRL